MNPVAGIESPSASAWKQALKRPLKLLLTTPLAIALGLACCVHIGLAIGLGLSPDEAHYALYGIHLDWSYYDHPPLVGWLQALPAYWGGQDGLMRGVPTLTWCAGAVTLMALVQQLWPQDMGVRRLALWLWLLSPMVHLLGIAWVPDTLLMPLTGVVMALTWRLGQSLKGPREAHADKDMPLEATQASQTSKGVTGMATWLALGLSLGLCGLSKYTSVLLGLSALAWLLRQGGLGLFKQSGFWGALLAACLLTLPVFYWNWQNDWASFGYQLHHTAGGGPWQLYKVVAYFLVQCLAYGPLLAWGLWAAGRTQSPATRSPLVFCAFFGVPALLLLVLTSGRGGALPHWTLSAWMALLPVAAWGWAQRLKAPRSRGSTGLWRALVGLQTVGLALAFWLLVSAGWLPGVNAESGPQATAPMGQSAQTAPNNPLADLWGWSEVAPFAQQLAQGLSSANGGQVPALAVMNWSLASRLAWYARPSPVKVVHSHHDQFDRWFGELQAGESVLLVNWSLMDFAPPIGPNAFAECEAKGQIPVIHWGRQLAHFNLLWCQHWQGAVQERAAP